MKPSQDSIGSSLAAGALIRRSGDCASGTVGDETVMMNIETGDYVGLNETGGRIWELVQTPVTLTQLCEKLHDEFDAPAAQIAEHVAPFVVELVQKGVVLLDLSQS